MKIYKVGGAVRDQILGKIATDNDYVVVGATPDVMLKLGFMQVGRDFPVFLHPKTHEEYALARAERKIAAGYHGFEFDTNPNISLIEDLQRRDLTINAMAIDEEGNLIDPFNGQLDLENKILRHVSKAFSEDPLRILRVARFSAQLNFTTAPETLALMQQIVASGELTTLSGERIWSEVNKALMTDNSSNFFILLEQTHALQFILPGLTTVMQNDITRAELFQALARVAQQNFTLEQRFAVLQFYALCTSMHSVAPEDTDCRASLAITGIHVNNKCKQLAIQLISHYDQICNLKKLNSAQIYTLIQRLDPFRNPHRYELFTQVIQLIATIKQHDDIEINLHTLALIINKIQNLDYASMAATRHNKADLGQHIQQIKITLIEEIL